MSDDEPNIALKIKFDQMTPELINFIYLLTVLVIISSIYLILLTINFAVTKVIKVYNYFKQFSTDYTQMLFD